MNSIKTFVYQGFALLGLLLVAFNGQATVHETSTYSLNASVEQSIAANWVALVDSPGTDTTGSGSNTGGGVVIVEDPYREAEISLPFPILLGNPAPVAVLQLPSSITYPVTIHIMSLTGQTVLEESIHAGQGRIRLGSHLNDGHYVIRATPHAQSPLPMIKWTKR